MLIPCQSPIWCPIQRHITCFPFVLLVFFCYCAWNMHSSAWTLLLWQSFICCLSFAPPSWHFMSANTWISMLVGFFPYSISQTQKIFIVNIFKDLCAIYYFKIYISKYVKHLTKTAVVSYCPSMSCSCLVLPCLSESICCPISALAECWRTYFNCLPITVNWPTY